VNAILPLLWECPGGKVELGETDEVALRRELQERLGADIAVGRKLGETHHAYEGYWVVMAMYEATLQSDRLETRLVQDYRWVASTEMEQYEFPPADQATMEKLLGLYGKAAS